MLLFTYLRHQFLHKIIFLMLKILHKFTVHHINFYRNLQFMTSLFTKFLFKLQILQKFTVYRINFYKKTFLSCKFYTNLQFIAYIFTNKIF